VQPVALLHCLRPAHLQVGGNKEQDVCATFSQHAPDPYILQAYAIRRRRNRRSRHGKSCPATGVECVSSVTVGIGDYGKIGNTPRCPLIGNRVHRPGHRPGCIVVLPSSWPSTPQSSDDRPARSAAAHHNFVSGWYALMMSRLAPRIPMRRRYSSTCQRFYIGLLPSNFPKIFNLVAKHRHFRASAPPVRGSPARFPKLP